MKLFASFLNVNYFIKTFLTKPYQLPSLPHSFGLFEPFAPFAGSVICLGALVPWRASFSCQNPIIFSFWLHVIFFLLLFVPNCGEKLWTPPFKNLGFWPQQGCHNYRAKCDMVMFHLYHLTNIHWNSFIFKPPSVNASSSNLNKTP